ncbi:MAG: hypothetical protein FWF79_07070 [Defluviitaleaceae bacterium]|nr:hypothetical protein [Defluviitaleaceae bacterium]
MKNSRKQKFNFTLDNEWAIFFLFVIGHSIVSFMHRAPFYFTSEYNVLSIGNWMSGGEEWGYRSAWYHGYTFSPFIGFVMLFFDHISHVYVGSLIFKSLQISLIPFFTYKILKEVLDVKDPLTRIFISIAVGTFPSFVLYSKLLSNMTTLHFVMFICLYIIAKLTVLEKGKTFKLWLYSAVLGFFAVFAYASHGIGLAFIPAIVVTAVIAHIFLKKKIVSYISLAASLGIFFVIDMVLKEFFIDNLFRVLVARGIPGNTLESSIGRVGRTFGNLDRFLYFIRLFVARVYYSIAATHLILLLAGVFMVVFLWHFFKDNFSKSVPENKKPRNIPVEQGVFVLVIFSIIIWGFIVGLTSVHNLSTALGRGGRFWFYGRYHSFSALPAVMMGLYFITCKEYTYKTWIKYAGITAGIFLAMALYVNLTVWEGASTGPVTPLVIPDILPFLGNATPMQARASTRLHNHGPLILISMAVFAVSVILVYTERKRKVFVPLVLAALFIYASYFSLNATSLTSSRSHYNSFFAHWRQPRSELEEFRDLHDQFPSLYVVSDSMSGSGTYQATLQSRGQLNFMSFSVTRTLRNNALENRRLTANSIVISDQDHPTGHVGRNAIKIHESEYAHIWIIGDDIIDYYQNQRGR